MLSKFQHKDWQKDIYPQKRFAKAVILAEDTFSDLSLELLSLPLLYYCTFKKKTLQANESCFCIHEFLLFWIGLLLKLGWCMVWDFIKQEVGATHQNVHACVWNYLLAWHCNAATRTRCAKSTNAASCNHKCCILINNEGHAWGQCILFDLFVVWRISRISRQKMFMPGKCTEIPSPGKYTWTRKTPPPGRIVFVCRFCLSNCVLKLALWESTKNCGTFSSHKWQFWLKNISLKVDNSWKRSPRLCCYSCCEKRWILHPPSCSIQGHSFPYKLHKAAIGLSSHNEIMHLASECSTTAAGCGY